MKIKTILGIGFSLIALVIGGLGTLSISEIKILHEQSVQLGVKNAPLVDAIMEIKLTATMAHLWFEEIIAGAESKEEIEQVWSLLDQALWFCDAIILGGKSKEGTFYAVKNKIIENKIFLIKRDIKEFTNIAKLRLDNYFGDKTLQDQALDDKFDSLFKQLIENADIVETIIQDKMAEDALQMNALVKSSTKILWGAILTSFLMVIFLIYMISRQIMRQIGGEPIEIAKITENVATGQLYLPLAIDRRKITGVYASVLNMVDNLKAVIADIVKVSQAMAAGQQDVLPTAENYQGDFVSIKEGLTTTTTKLGEATQQNIEQDWLKTGQMHLNERLRGEQDIPTISKQTIDFLTSYIEAHIGLFYLVYHPEDAPAYLQMLASYAYPLEEGQSPPHFILGQGLVGQVALEKKVFIRTHSLEECTHIVQSGLTNTVPRYVIILPFLYENTVVGIIEIGHNQPFTQLQQYFLEQVMPIIGIAVNMAESRRKMQALLQQSQQQTKSLQAQQDKLRQANEELQAQSEELRTQQEELNQTNTELEERTQALEFQKAEIQHKNQALEKTRHEIEEKAHDLELASKYKSEFLANMSHELRTPLNSLLILAQLLTENKPGNLSEKQVEYAKTIYSAGSDLLTLINEILDLSKIEAGKIEINANDIDLSDLITSIEHKFQPIAVDKNLQFNTIVSDKVPETLNSDSQRLKQIINNLLSNAFKFTAQGEINLKIQSPQRIPFKSQIPTNSMIAISISDSGIGIPKDKQKVVFEAFQQADGTTSRKYGGTGLGLSISRQLSRLLGGDIILEGEEGKGCIFTLYLPVVYQKITVNTQKKKENTQVSVPKISAEPVETSPEQAISNKGNLVKIQEQVAEDDALTSAKESIYATEDDRHDIQLTDKVILIIEDDESFAHILLKLAHEKDFKCLVAEDGILGLTMVDKYQPHAIILDIGLPKIDGLTVMERLKRNADTRHIPVHFISASEQSMDAKKMGAIGYLLKPVSMEELTESFKNIETFIDRTIKNLLILVDHPEKQTCIENLIAGMAVDSKFVTTRKMAYQKLKQQIIDCLIVDIDVEQGLGVEILEQLYQGYINTPIILYADRELTMDEAHIIQQCESNLTIKSVRSPEYLLDEATLFLHQIEGNLPQDKQRILRMIHDKESILMGKKVLVVDDDIRNTFALATVLEEKNMEVITAKNGKEALNILDEQTDTDIVLMDIMMPEMDGYEAISAIREQMRFRQLPIIALTAKAMKGDKTKCFEVGANDYLAKPVNTDKLVSLMRVWLYR